MRDFKRFLLIRARPLTSDDYRISPFCAPLSRRPIPRSVRCVFSSCELDDLERFILREARQLSPISVRSTLVALRCFLRYALQRGWIKADLAIGLPKVACWRYSHIPRSLTPEQMERLLASCDHGTADGLRNHAILLLLARLGLRAKELSTLRTRGPGLGSR